MKTQKWMMVAVALLVIAPGIFPARAAQDEFADIKKVLEKILPHGKPERIAQSVIPGLYEVNYGAEVLYVSKDGRYLVMGDLINVESRSNLTEQARSKGRLALINGIDPSSMIVFAPEKVKHTVTVFTDIDCSYCRKMHGQMAEYNARGIAFRYLAYPRAGINSPSYNKAVSVWCAKDRREAMTKAKRGETPENKTCDNPVKAHMAAANRIGIDGTPTLLLEDGYKLTGYVEPAKLSEMLDKGPGAFSSEE